MGTTQQIKRHPLPRLILADGTVEALKWLALLAMTFDHINKYLFNETLPILFELGRLALPIFVSLLAYNLARPGTLASGAYTRTMKRLAVFGTLASVPFIALGDLYKGWWPLNVLFTLLTLTATLYLAECGQLIAASAVLLMGGSVVEFWWPAVMLGVAVWAYCKQPTWIAAAITLLACASLCVINGNLWALASLPVLLGATCLTLGMPRSRWAFYVYYPLHFGVLWLIRIPLRHAGYLFF